MKIVKLTYPKKNSKNSSATLIPPSHLSSMIHHFLKLEFTTCDRVWKKESAWKRNECYKNLNRRIFGGRIEGEESGDSFLRLPLAVAKCSRDGGSENKKRLANVSLPVVDYRDMRHVAVRLQLKIRRRGNERKHRVYIQSLLHFFILYRWAVYPPLSLAPYKYMWKRSRNGW